MPLTLRPITEADQDFLLRLYGTVRADELAQVPWTDEQKAAFVLQQFTAQHAWWTEHYPDATFDVVLLDGEPVGRLYVEEWKQEIRVIDIALLPEHRGRGLGAGLLERVIARGDAAGKAVSIHVEQYNPARRLYERLGFEHRGQASGVYLLMVRPPRPAPDPRGDP